jgi:hypothetical protein
MSKISVDERYTVLDGHAYCPHAAKYESTPRRPVHPSTRKEPGFGWTFSGIGVQMTTCIREECFPPEPWRTACSFDRL